MKEKIETNVIKPEISFLENEIVNLIISPLEESILDNKIIEIQNFMKDNWRKGKSESEKDELYKSAQVIWHGFINAIKDAKFSFHLNRRQYNFLTDLLLKKMEYDVNTVFFAIELTNLLGIMKDAKYSNDKDLVAFTVNATEITYIYHLISKYKVKGLCNDAYLFSQVLIRISGISKIFNYYETASKNLSNEIQDWIVTLDEGVNVEESISIDSEVVEATAVKPKKKAKEEKV